MGISRAPGFEEGPQREGVVSGILGSPDSLGSHSSLVPLV